MPRIITQEELDRVAHLSSRKAAAILGVGKSTINDARKAAAETPAVNGAVEAVSASVPTNEAEVKDFLKTRGIDELTHKINYRVSSWETPTGVQHSFRATAVAQDGAAPTVDWSAGKARIENFDFVPAPKDTLTEALVLQPTDYQIGKTDANGGTAESTQRALTSFAKFAEIVKDRKPEYVLLANTGDIIENFCNTAAQLGTNDLDLPHQVGHAFALELEALRMLAPLAPRVVYATVPSNHGQWRSGPKSALGDSHADWGVVIAEQVATAMTLNNSFNGVVEVHAPPLHYESMTVQLGSSRIGLVHGHQRGTPEKLGEWWAHQDHGRMPTWDADILLAGHFHSFRAFQSGDGRWVFVGPSSDPGSSWYANLTGQRAVAGMLSFAVENGTWSDLAIL
jgi:hypothetical protein